MVYGAGRTLPPYRAVLVVDARDFTAPPRPAGERAADLVPALLGGAFVEAGLGAYWAAPAARADRADGHRLVLPTSVLPRLIDTVPLLLEERLTRYGQERRAGDPELRLRMSVDVRPAAHAPAQDPPGRHRELLHRLHDTPTVRAVLAGCTPASHLAMLLADRVYRDVVLARYTRLLPEQLLPVTGTPGGRGELRQAWLHVPRPSGTLAAAGVAAAGAPHPLAACPVPPGQPGAGRRPDAPAADKPPPGRGISPGR
ncbi:MAG TPA: hypothetical protein VFY17_02890 [Pilimelia sp.]|nr:hypothetical protein [Pilimelia sp.]